MSNHLTHPDPGMVYACPNCDIALLHERMDNGPTGRPYKDNPDDPFYCHGCRRSCSEAIERQTRQGKEAALLANLSPEDLGLSPLGSAKPNA